MASKLTNLEHANLEDGADLSIHLRILLYDKSRGSTGLLQRLFPEIKLFSFKDNIAHFKSGNPTYHFSFCGVVIDQNKKIDIENWLNSDIMIIRGFYFKAREVISLVSNKKGAHIDSRDDPYEAYYNWLLHSLNNAGIFTIIFEITDCLMKGIICSEEYRQFCNKYNFKNEQLEKVYTETEFEEGPRFTITGGDLEIIKEIPIRLHVSKSGISRIYFYNNQIEENIMLYMGKEVIDSRDPIVLKRLADFGNACAQQRYAKKLVLGDGVDRDIKASIDYYTKSADSGNILAHKELTDVYLQLYKQKIVNKENLGWALGNAFLYASSGWYKYQDDDFKSLLANIESCLDDSSSVTEKDN